MNDAVGMSLEWTQGIFRCGYGHVFGEPYTGVATIIAEGSVAYVKGLTLKDIQLKGEFYKDFCDFLRDKGFKTVRFERVKNGVTTYIERDITERASR